MPAAVQAHREISLNRNRLRQRKDVCVEVVWISLAYLWFPHQSKHCPTAARQRMCG